MTDLRAPGAILLVSLYELGHQPHGLALPLGFLTEAGFQPAALDLAAEAFDAARVTAARVLLVSVPMHTALRMGVRFVARARALNPDAVIVLYGLYAGLNAEYLFSQGVDAVVAGEYEEALVQLCQACAAGKSRAALAAVPGVQTPLRPAAPVLARLQFARPARQSLIPLARYARYDPGDGSPLRAAGYVEASRGCLHLCRHCPIPPIYGGRFFVVPKELVLDDVAVQVAAGAEHITFGDPDFLNGPRHALAVARGLHDRFPQLTFDVTAKVEHILQHAGVWSELYALGLRFVVSAVESLSPRVLQLLEKGHTKEDVHRALQVLRAAGVAMRPSLVAFTPWTTLDDYLELCDFVSHNQLYDNIDPVQLTIRLLVPPGSYLLTLPEMQQHLGPLEPSALAHRWAHPDPRMDVLHQRATALVAEAAEQQGRAGYKEAPQLIVHRMRALAEELAGRTAPDLATLELLRSAHTQSAVPRLTEPWFC